MTNKPWEGKHWIETDRFLREYEKSGDTAIISIMNDGMIIALERLKEALKKDWEEQQLKPVIYHEEWGGCLRAVIDGKPQNIADHLNKKYTETVECAQTAEKEKSGHQESSEFCPTCGTALGEPWEYERFRPPSFLKSEKEDRLIKNLMMSISMQRDEMDELKRKFHDVKKAESFTSPNCVSPEQPLHIDIKGDGFFETVAQDDGSILVRPKWIPLSERLPEDYEHVLVFDKDEGVCVGFVHLSSWSHHPMGDFATRAPLFNVIAWMPLPPPPEES